MSDGLRSRLYVAANGFSFRGESLPKHIIALEVEPQFRGRIEVASEAERRSGGDGPLTSDDLADPIGGNAKGAGKRADTEPQRPHELFTEDFAGGNGRGGVLRGLGYVAQVDLNGQHVIHRDAHTVLASVIVDELDTVCILAVPRQAEAAQDRLQGAWYDLATSFMVPTCAFRVELGQHRSQARLTALQEVAPRP